MKLFTPEDFIKELNQKPMLWPQAWQELADIANKILELKSIIVYSIGEENLFAKDYKAYFQNKPTYKALIINIEPLEKK